MVGTLTKLDTWNDNNMRIMLNIYVDYTNYFAQLTPILCTLLKIDNILEPFNKTTQFITTSTYWQQKPKKFNSSYNRSILQKINYTVKFSISVHISKNKSDNSIVISGN